MVKGRGARESFGGRKQRTMWKKRGKERDDSTPIPWNWNCNWNWRREAMAAGEREMNRKLGIE